MDLTVGSVAIRHIASAVPAKTIHNSSLDFDAKIKKKIFKFTGVASRHVLDDEMSLMDLYLPAASKALLALGWEADSIDGIICVSQTHEHKLPSTACILQDRTGASTRAFAYDMSMGCSGYPMGLFSTMTAMSAARGSLRRVLLFVGDAISTLCHPKDKSTVFLFGDAGSCTALEYDESARDVPFRLWTDGSGWDAIRVEHGGLKHPICNESLVEFPDESGNLTTNASVRMKGADIFDFTLSEVPPYIDALLKYAGLEKNDIDVYCLHQANAFMLEHIRQKAGINEKVPINLENYGNTSCASIPLLIADRPEQCLKPNVMLIGFGVGLSIAGCIVNLESTTASLEVVN